MPDSEDIAALAAICAGKQPEASRAYEGLDRRFRPQFRRFFLTNRQSEADADDIAQEAFLKIWRSACSFAGRSLAAPWIWRIARNSLIDNARRKGRSLEVELTDEMLETIGDIMMISDTLEEHERLEAADEALNRLREKDPMRAETMRLAVIEEWSTAELMTFTERTNGATREYLSQTRKVYRKVLLEVLNEFVAGSK